MSKRHRCEVSSAKGNVREEIVDYIRRNRVSSTEVADCLEKTGAIPGLHPLRSGLFCVGKAFWCYAQDGTNWTLHEQLRRVEEGDIVVAEALNCEDRALFGDLVSKYLLLYRQVRAVVVCGKMRDAHRLTKEGWPIWCHGFTPIGCFNRPPEHPADPTWVAERRRLYDGAVVVCDDTGVVVIELRHQTRKFLGKLAAIEAQEDVWYECIDRRKWDTFDTVCLKRYANKGGRTLEC